MSLYLVFELSNKNWKLGFSCDGFKGVRIVDVPAGDLFLLEVKISQTLAKWSLSKDETIVTMYEAGRDGFWLDRYLKSKSRLSHIVDPGSIETKRRKKQIKTDRIDVRKLMNTFKRFLGGEQDACSMVRVPSLEQELAMRLGREIKRIQKEEKAHASVIGSLLKLHGIELNSYRDGWSKFADNLDSYQQYNSQALPELLRDELLREHQRLMLAQQQRKALEKQRANHIKGGAFLEAASEELNYQQKVQLQSYRLCKLCGIAEVGSHTLVTEFFGWRDFENVRQVGACAGLVGCPFNSGEAECEQGISKAGNKRVRSLIIQLAWGWIRFQPQSELSLWFKRRFALGGKRMRRKGIVALGRKLLIALWKYLQHDTIPEGALLKAYS